MPRFDFEKALRRKIEQDSKHPGLIRTVRGKGYTLSLEESPAKSTPEE